VKRVLRKGGRYACITLAQKHVIGMSIPSTLKGVPSVSACNLHMCSSKRVKVLGGRPLSHCNLRSFNNDGE
jgi:hypothetical protein